MATHGIDVSVWQGDIDWAKVKKSGKVKFAILKAGGSDSGYYKDSKFEQNYKNAKAQGIPLGAYYFVGKNCTTVAEGITCANKFLEYLKDKQFEYPVYIDCEVTAYSAKTGATDAALAFMQKVQNAGYWVGIYGSTYSTFQSRVNDSRLQGFAHWVAQYASSCTYTGKVGIGIWQYSSSVSVDGISGRVDGNYCYVDYPTKIKAKGLNGFSKASTASSTASTSTGNKVTANNTTASKNDSESDLRAKVVALADSYIGCVRGDAKHKEIIDVFNTVQPDGWPMNYVAAWCATFVSAISIKYFGKQKAKEYFPLSANCAGIIRGAIAKGIWVEADDYVPSPGDWIIYDWDDNGIGEDTTGYDHVGMVKSVANNKITVIEGNRNDKCAYRTIAVNGRYIRGFVHPKYATLAGVTTTVATNTTQTTGTSATSATSVKLAVDGSWGKLTTKALQEKLGVTQDGVISNQLTSCKKYLEACSGGWEFYSNPKGNSATIVALQKKIGVTADGYIGFNTVKMLQQFLNREIKAGLAVDGYCGKKTVKALQTWLNIQ